MNAIKFCDLTFKGLDRKSILRNSETQFSHIITVGAEFIVEAHKNSRIMALINNNISTFDGQVPYVFAKRQNRKVKFEKISGADFIYDVCDYAIQHQKRIFLLGGFPDSNAGSIERLTQMGIKANGFVTGFIPYPFPQDRIEEIRQHIAAFKPHFLFVALGMPKQEYMIDENRQFLIDNGVQMAIGCGGTFEVFSGKVRRAPKIIQKAGLESIYRVLINPTKDRFQRFFNKCVFLKYALRN